MRATDSDRMPSSLRAYAAMLWHRRPGLRDPAAMPRIERSVASVCLKPEWLRAYRACVGLDEATQAPLPPLALQIAAAPLHLSILADARFPFKALGLVHVAQRVTQVSAIAPGQAVQLLACTTNAQWARRGMAFGLVTEASVDRQVLWRAETTALAFGASPSAGSAKKAPAVTPEAEPWCPVLSLAVPESLGRHYASIAGDLNPIHQHALLARPFGFRHAIIHGTWTLARALAGAGLPASSAYAIDAHFRRPVALPSEILISTRSGRDHSDIQVTGRDGTDVHVTARVSA